MDTLLRVLLVEDSNDDAALLLRELKRGGFEPVYEQVDTPEAMKAALGNKEWEIVLSDYIMPRFSGPAALNILKENGLDLPIIIISGKIGEDVAVEVMKAGAHDYIVKGKLSRLVPAVRRELREVAVRRARIKAEEALKEAEREKTMILDNMSEHMIYINQSMQVVWANKAASESFELTPEEMIGRYCFEIRDHEQKCANCPGENTLQSGQVTKSEVKTADGKVWLVRAYPVRDNDEVVGAVNVLLDITEQKKIEEQLRSAHQQLNDIIEFLPDATFVVDKDSKVIAWNRAIQEMTGVCKEDILGKGDLAYAIPFYGEPRPILVDLVFSYDEKLASEYEYIKKNGNILYAETYVPQAFRGKGAYLWATASTLFDDKGKMAGAIETIRDITARKKMENQLRHIARHDFLTNTPNRYALEESLKKAVTRAKCGERSALLFLDLDNFKIVNDTLGHTAGDELLITLANRLKSNLRPEDILFRFGGDEFAILLDEISSKKACEVAERLRFLINEDELCLSMYKTCFNLTISVGIVMVEGALEADQILANADTALYTAKEQGRNRIILIEPDAENTKRLTESNQLVGLIKSALKENLFSLFFQPVVNTADRRITHYEALLRLKKKDGDFLLPSQFIPIAENFGLMTQIDHWVVRTSFQALEKNNSLNLFINLSGISLGDDKLLEVIESSILRIGLKPSRIGFELTETVAIKDITRAEQWIRKLKNLGCKFALDDFGIGFSSFSYLSMLPVDFLKIDGSFIQNLDTNSTHQALVKAINAAAHTLGKKTIAEFVENEETLKILHEINIDYSQGYYLGKPLPMVI